MIRKDTLWKGILEDLADDMLKFFFPEKINTVDWERPFESLDKELQRLMPQEEGMDRRADKLFKVSLKNGDEQWFLVHVEVQGYDDKAFARRMYEYYYRIQDRYGQPVTALAIYTNANRACHFDHYAQSFWGTELIYRFNTFVLLDYPPERLAQSDNIFAAVLEASWQGLIRRSWQDEALFKYKLSIVRHLMERQYPKNKIQRVLNFIAHYVSFTKTDFSRKFENTLSTITKSNAPMGIIEAIQEELKKQAWEEGLQEGRKERREEERAAVQTTIVTNMLKKELTVAFITEVTGVDEARVLAIKAQLEADGEL